MTAPDYSTYDAGQLRQVLGRIDRERFPERVAAIDARLAELARAAPVAVPYGVKPVADRSAYAPLLRGPAWAWLAFGMLEIAHTAWLTRESGWFFVNFVPLLMSVLLLSSGLTLANLLRWSCWAMLPWAVAGVLSQFLQPVGLTVALWRYLPFEVLVPLVKSVVGVLLLAWTTHRLGAAPIALAREVEGRKRYNMRWPLALGLVGSIGVIGFTMSALLGERAQHGQLLVMAQVPGKLRFHVLGLNVQKNNSGTFCSATVAFWSDDGVGRLTVNWKE